MNWLARNPYWLNRLIAFLVVLFLIVAAYAVVSAFGDRRILRYGSDPLALLNFPLLAALIVLVGEIVIDPFRTEPRYKNWEQFAKLSEIGIFIVGAMTAISAFLSYVSNNEVAMLLALEERDMSIRSVYMGERSSMAPAKPGSSAGSESAVPEAFEGGGSNLIRLFSDGPDTLMDGENYVDADAYPEAFKDCNLDTRSKISRWAHHYVEAVTNDRPEWNNIPDLYDRIWGAKEVLSGENNTSRVFVMHAIDYLYIVHDAYLAWYNGYFTDSQFEMWRAYFDDLGLSPLFLVAFWDGIKYGYMERRAADTFLEYIESLRDHRENARVFCTFQALFECDFESQQPKFARHSCRQLMQKDSELLEPDWRAIDGRYW